jgi:hypothetical protein
MKKILLSALLIGVGGVGGWLVRGEKGAGGGGQEGVKEFTVDQPDPSHPSGRSIRSFTVYRISSPETGILSGTIDPPEGPKPTFVTVAGRETVRYYGRPKEVD